MKLVTTLFAFLYSVFKYYGFSYIKLKDCYQWNYSSPRNNGTKFWMYAFWKILQYFQGSWDVITMSEFKMVREIVKPSRRHWLCWLT